MTARHRRAAERPFRSLAAGFCVGVALLAAGLITRVYGGDLLTAPQPPVRPPSLDRVTALNASQHASKGARLSRPFAAVAQAAAPIRMAAPVRVRVPAIGVDSRLQPLHRLPDGTLQPPSRWQRAGYYADGVRPGEVGPAVIVGHVDSVQGPAVFYRLRDLRAGDRILVQLRDGRTLRFAVDRAETYPKNRFPAAAVYGPTPVPQLRLVTCTGEFDWAERSYLDNLVVYADLMRPSGGSMRMH